MKLNYEFTPAIADFISACLAVGVTRAYGSIVQHRDALKILDKAKARFRYKDKEQLLENLTPLIEQLERIRDMEVT